MSKVDLGIADGRWHHIAGDMNLATYGGTLARYDGDGWYLIEIQPVLEYVGSRDGAEVGYPFWTRVGYADEDDIIAAVADDFFARSVDLESWFEGDPLHPSLEEQGHIACAMLSYGLAQHEDGPSGWGQEILDYLGDHEVVLMGSDDDLEADLAEQAQEFAREVIGEDLPWKKAVNVFTHKWEVRIVDRPELPPVWVCDTEEEADDDVTDHNSLL